MEYSLTDMRLKMIPREILPIGGLLVFGILMGTLGYSDSLDSRLFYSAAEAKVFFQYLSHEQSRAYLKNEFFDLGFIVSYTLLFYWLYRRMVSHRSWLSALALIPGAFDLIETSVIIGVLSGGVQSPPAWLGFATCLKWTTGAIFVLIAAYRWFTVRRSS
jgi:hypothetical protein